MTIMEVPILKSTCSTGTLPVRFCRLRIRYRFICDGENRTGRVSVLLFSDYTCRFPDLPAALPSKDRSEEPQDDSRRTAPGGIRPAHQALEALGAVSRREAVGNGSRRLQSGRSRVGIFSARACAVARLSLGGRRPRRDQRPSSANVLRAGALEWARPYPQGTLVWSERQ